MLEKLKLMLGITDDDLNEKLMYILDAVSGRLKLLLGGIEPPEEMEHIIIDVAVIRFNRIGSEGMSQNSVEGESITFTGNDFDGYMDEIQAYLDGEKEAKRGKVRFI